MVLIAFIKCHYFKIEFGKILIPPLSQNMIFTPGKSIGKEIEKVPKLIII
jgi:hypothetical protein